MGKKWDGEKKKGKTWWGCITFISQFWAVMTLFSQIVTKKWLHQLQTVFFLPNFQEQNV